MLLDGWMDGWREVKAILRIAYSNEKSVQDLIILHKLYPDSPISLSSRPSKTIADIQTIDPALFFIVYLHCSFVHLLGYFHILLFCLDCQNGVVCLIIEQPFFVKCNFSLVVVAITNPLINFKNTSTHFSHTV